MKRDKPRPGPFKKTIVFICFLCCTVTYVRRRTLPKAWWKTTCLDNDIDSPFPFMSTIIQYTRRNNICDKSNVNSTKLQHCPSIYLSISAANWHTVTTVWWIQRERFVTSYSACPFVSLLLMHSLYSRKSDDKVSVLTETCVIYYVLKS